MSAEEYDFGATNTGGGEGGSGPSTRTIQLDEPPASVINLLLAGINQEGGFLEYPVHADDAQDIPEDMHEAFNLPDDVETFSVEDLFQLDEVEAKYFGSIPTTSWDTWDIDDLLEAGYKEEFLHTDEDGEAEPGYRSPHWVDVTEHTEDGYEWELKDNITINGSLRGQIQEAVNAYYLDKVWEEVDEDGQFKVLSGRKTDHGGDVFEAREHLRFNVSVTEKTAERALKDVAAANLISEDQFDDILEAEDRVEALEEAIEEHEEEDE